MKDKISNKDYLQRVKTWESSEKFYSSDGASQRIYATRMRDNNDFQMIVIHYGDQKMEFHNDNALSDNGSIPEFVATEVAKILDAACMDRCELPEIKK